MEVFKAHKVDLVVSDENMPGILGTKLLSWVAQHYPEVTRIMLTGYPTIPSALSAINEGRVHRYFTKPCDVVQLALAIREALESKQVSKC